MPEFTMGGLRADPRLPAYLAGGFGALIAAIATGQHEWAALGAPFLVLAAFGVIGRMPGGVRASVTIGGGHTVEGDLIDGEVSVNWDGEAEVDVLLSDWRGVEPVEPGPDIGWCLPLGAGPARLTFRLRASVWGVHDGGALWVRVRQPGALIMREQKLAAGSTLRVLPTALRLDSLLSPSEPRAVSGMHQSRLRGEGTDFAGLRPYRPGDRVRNLSWTTSARLGVPWVAVHHLERTGTVLMLLDAFSRDRMGREALARAARAAWAIASAHLHAQDRVGLLAQGPAPAWLPPRAGRRARWLLMEELLAVGGAAEDVWRPRHLGTRVAIPADALIVGVTALAWPPFIRDLLHYRRSGHATVALVIDTSDLLAEGAGAVDRAARRLWIAQRDAGRQTLHRGGVSTALVTAGSGVAPAVSLLSRRMTTPRGVRRGVVA